MKLASDLRELWHEPWLDELEIKVGENIVSRIEHGISEADYVIVVLSPFSVESGWVEREWQAKYLDEMKQKKPLILPVLLRDCRIPPLLKNKKYADFRKNYAVGLVKLIDAINIGISQVPFEDRSTLPPLTKRTAKAHDMWFCGISEINVMGHEDYFHEKLNEKEGVCIRVLVIDPECQAARSAADCTLDNLGGIKSDIERTILRVKHIIDKGVGKGSIELRLMEVAPGYSMIIIDPEKPDGQISVEFIGYKTPTDKRPHIELIKQRDNYWFNFFLMQYNMLWEKSKERLSSDKL